jgi:hypothetical protein
MASSNGGTLGCRMFFTIPEMVETLAEYIDIISLVVLRLVSKQTLAATTTLESRHPGPLPEFEAAEVLFLAVMLRTQLNRMRLFS